MTNPIARSDVPPFYIPSESAKMTLWMGDLESWMDEQFLRQLWNAMGETVIVKLIRDKRSGLSLGYAFIGFSSPMAAQRALTTAHGTKMPNSQRNFRLNWASGGGILDKKEDRAPEFSLFVGDLSNDVDETYLLAMFRQRYDSCHSAKVMTDPVSGLSRGYGFVRFHDPQEQMHALVEMNGVYCGQRPIRISLATPKSTSNSTSSTSHLSSSLPASPPPGQASHHAPTVSNGAFPPVSPALHQLQQQQASQSQQFLTSPHLSPSLSSSSSPPPSLPPSSSFSASSGTTSPSAASQAARYFQLAMQAPALVQQPTDPSNTTVFVGGLSTPISEEELLQYFSPFGEVTYVKIPPGKGCGFVQYVARASAEMAIERMNGFQIGQSRIRLSWGRSQYDKTSSSLAINAAPVPQNSNANANHPFFAFNAAPSTSTSSSSTSTTNNATNNINPSSATLQETANAMVHQPSTSTTPFAPTLSPPSSNSSSTSTFQRHYYATPISPTSPLDSSSNAPVASSSSAYLRHAYEIPHALMPPMPPISSTSSSIKPTLGNVNRAFPSSLSPPTSFGLGAPANGAIPNASARHDTTQTQHMMAQDPDMFDFLASSSSPPFQPQHHPLHHGPSSSYSHASAAFALPPPKTHHRDWYSTPMAQQQLGNTANNSNASMNDVSMAMPAPNGTAISNSNLFISPPVSVNNTTASSSNAAPSTNGQVTSAAEWHHLGGIYA